MNDLPDAALIYLLGSRYCDADRLATEAWRLSFSEFDEMYSAAIKTGDLQSGIALSLLMYLQNEIDGGPETEVALELLGTTIGFLLVADRAQSLRLPQVSGVIVPSAEKGMSRCVG